MKKLSRRIVALLCVGFLLATLCISAGTSLAQEPEPGKEVSASAWSDESCSANAANFVIPPGWIGTKVRAQASTSWLPCSGIGHTDRVGYTVTGPVSWTEGVTWSGDEYGTDPPEILPSGNYQISLESHGKHDSYALYYTLQPDTCTPGERKTVSAWSDTECVPHETLFTIPSGCIATDISTSINTSWLPCSGPGHPDRVGYTLTGPGGSWTREVTWAGDESGPALPTTLPAGNYKFEMSSWAKGDSCSLSYTLQKAPGGPGAVTPTVLYPGDPDATLSDLDLIFCIDVTGSMEDDIAGVKAAAADIVNTIAAKNDNYRVAIVAYRDWDDSMGLPMFEDYAFSKDKATIIANVNSLSVGGGDDTPEAVFEALMRAIDSQSVGGWRNNVNKQIILMGDAPPHNPSREGLTPAIVAKAAEDADPVVIQALVVGNYGEYDPEAVTAFRELAELTKGNFFEAADASKVPEMLQETIKDIDTPSVSFKLPSNTVLLAIGALCCLGVIFVIVILFVVVFWNRRGGRKPRRAARAPVAAPPPPQPSAAHWQGQTLVASAVITAELVVEEGPDAGQRFSLKPDTRLGRAADNDIVLRDPQSSRHHAVINFIGSEYVIADLGSANGTLVNGVRINQPCALRHGDVVAIGADQMVFQQR
jgi:Mg-chelatase subunit ChlD